MLKIEKTLKELRDLQNTLLDIGIEMSIKDADGETKSDYEDAAMTIDVYEPCRCFAWVGMDGVIHMRGIRTTTSRVFGWTCFWTLLAATCRRWITSRNLGRTFAGISTASPTKYLSPPNWPKGKQNTRMRPTDCATSSKLTLS